MSNCQSACFAWLSTLGAWEPWVLAQNGVVFTL